MRKSQAKQVFGGTLAEMADALGVTASAISQWPEELSLEQTDRVTGAAVRLGRYRVLREIVNLERGQSTNNPAPASS